MTKKQTDVGPVEPINSEQLAGKVLYQLYQDLFKVQNDIIALEARMLRFGKDAMPNYHHTRRVLREAPDMINRELQSLNKRQAEILATIRPLEDLFEASEAADLEAMVDFIRRRHAKK